ncbi:MAG: FliM/FliN family flagellar motor switch protein [Terriglobales bacterium]
MPPITLGTPPYALAEVFGKVIGEVLSQTLAATWTVEVRPDDGSAPSDESAPVCFGLSPSGGLRGSAAFLLRLADARSLGQKLLKEPADASSELNAEHKQAIEKLLNQVAEQTAVALKTEYGDVGLQLAGIEAPSWAGVAALLAASAGPAGTFSLQLRFSDELVAALPAAADAVGPLPAEAPLAVDSNLDLLLGVDLSLTLRFGQRTLTLREILDLSSGSVIELDRRVQEPADLLLGDKLIARGEVVIVDSNYGLRITEVCDAPHHAAKGALSAAP